MPVVREILARHGHAAARRSAGSTTAHTGSPARVGRGRREVGPLQLHRHRRPRDLPAPAVATSSGARTAAASSGCARRGDPLEILRAKLVALRPVTLAGYSLPRVPRRRGGHSVELRLGALRRARALTRTPTRLGMPDLWFVLPETIVGRVRQRAPQTAADRGSVRGADGDTDLGRAYREEVAARRSTRWRRLREPLRGRAARCARCARRWTCVAASRARRSTRW